MIKAIPLNLTPRRKEVLWHAAYSTAEWSAQTFYHYAWGNRVAANYRIKLGGTDVTEIVQKLGRARLIKFDVVEVAYRRCEFFIRITPLGMDVLLGNVECVDPKGLR